MKCIVNINNSGTLQKKQPHHLVAAMSKRFHFLPDTMSYITRLPQIPRYDTFVIPGLYNGDGFWNAIENDNTKQRQLNNFVGNYFEMFYIHVSLCLNELKT